MREVFVQMYPAGRGRAHRAWLWPRKHRVGLTARGCWKVTKGKLIKPGDRLHAKWFADTAPWKSEVREVSEVSGHCNDF